MKYELSIVTICYNCKEDLLKTLNSVESQIISENNYMKRLEYVVVDGASTDGTVDVAKNWKKSTTHSSMDVFVISEKDHGIYDAMNKGIKLTNGKWIILLNAGDTFHSNNDLDCLLNFLENEQNDIVYANYCRVNDYGVRYTAIQELSNLKKTMIFCHQATIVQKHLYCKYLYDLRYKLVADYAFFLKSYLEGYTFSYYDYYLINYDVNGESAKQMINTYKEIRKVRMDLLGENLGIVDRIQYGLGIIKRSILSYIPQNIRWYLTRLINCGNKR